MKPYLEVAPEAPTDSLPVGAARSRRRRTQVYGLSGQMLPETTVARDFNIAWAPIDERRRIHTIHNEPVKLNATLLQQPLVWFAGAGAVGALVDTLIASGAHNFAGAGEIAPK